jgi:hypothetical protein
MLTGFYARWYVQLVLIFMTVSSSLFHMADCIAKCGTVLCPIFFIMVVSVW